MAVSFDTKFESGASSQASPFGFVSNAGTVSGSVGSNSNRVLIGIVAFSTDVVTVGTVAMTWAGNAMTQIGSGLDTPGGFSIFMFGIKGDANVTTGAQTIQVTYTGAHTVVLGGISLFGCDTTNGWQNATTNTGTGTSATVAITTTSGNMVVGGRADDNGSSATIASGTQDWDERNFTGNYGGAHKASASGSESLTWTLGSSVGWAMKGADVIAAGAGGTTFTPAQGTPTFTGQAPILGKAILMPDQP